jgi:hypothetical protein
MAGPTQAQEPLPRKVSLIAEFQKLGLPPRVQGERDTCSLFAITALAEYECARHSPPPHRRLSEEFLIWAGNEASGLKGDQAMFYKAVNGLNALGICTEESMPYADCSDAKRRPSENALSDARERSGRWKVEWIKRWDLQRTLTDAEVRHIKQALARAIRWRVDFVGPKG